MPTFDLCSAEPWRPATYLCWKLNLAVEPVDMICGPCILVVEELCERMEQIRRQEEGE